MTTIMFIKIVPEFQCLEGWAQNSHVCSERIAKDEISIPMCIKIGQELQCYQWKDYNYKKSNDWTEKIKIPMLTKIGLEFQYCLQPKDIR